MAEFRAILGYPEYLISDQGVVASAKKNNFKFLKLFRNYAGYEITKLSGLDGREHIFFVHVLVLETFFSPRPEGLQCRHLNGNKRDNRLVNLDWGTPMENYDDRVRHGTQFTLPARFGVDNHKTKLTEDSVREIRSSSKTGVFLARKFGVSSFSISCVRRGITWRNVQ
jgi:hypothetical protein